MINVPIGLWALQMLILGLAVRITAALDDAEIARRIRDGDPKAFREFFDRNNTILLNYLKKRKVSEEIAEDIVQNAFLLIWERRRQIDDRKSLRAYLFRIGYTRALNHFRDTAKFEAGIDEMGGSPSDASTLESASYRLTRERLEQAVAALPERRRAVFELCFLQEFTYREAAEALDISVKTVENQMAHALKAIRQAMEPYR